ncbi:MAG: hypothetical protein DMF55_02560, partial [Acidobacteria bacterium]
MTNVFGLLLVLIPGAAAAVAAGGKASIQDVAPDLEQRLARFKPVEMPFSTEGLSARERKELDELVAACRDLENIFWRQDDPPAIGIYKSLAGSADPRDKALRHFVWLNASRYDLIDENKPFIGKEPLPPGRALYPRGLTRDQIEEYVGKHPEQKKAIFDERTVVSGNLDKLTTTPYHVKFHRWLVSAAGHLRRAASFSDDKDFARFLRLRAEGLLTDDYYPSDL